MLAWQIKDGSKGLLTRTPAACHHPGSPSKYHGGGEPWAVVGFKFLAIGSLFSGKLMFSVTWAFSHQDLGTCFKKTKFVFPWFLFGL